MFVPELQLCRMFIFTSTLSALYINTEPQLDQALSMLL